MKLLQSVCIVMTETDDEVWDCRCDQFCPRKKFVQNMLRIVEYVREKVINYISSQLRQCEFFCWLKSGVVPLI